MEGALAMSTARGRSTQGVLQERAARGVAAMTRGAPAHQPRYLAARETVRTGPGAASRRGMPAFERATRWEQEAFAARRGPRSAMRRSGVRRRPPWALVRMSEGLMIANRFP